MEETTQIKQDKKFNFSELLSSVINILIGVLAGLLIHNFVISTVLVSGQSMEPTFYDNQFLLLDRISGNFSDYERNDIVVVDVSKFELYKDRADNFYIIKRVIGTPGDKVYINDYGDIYINDRILDENSRFDTITDPGIAASEIKLHEDEYFVLGDNRNNSMDSRSVFIGVINKNNIVGKIISK